MDMNKLVGQTVTNRAYGKGSIVAFEEGRVTVRFSSKEASFQYPKAFEDGFLTAEDPLLQDELLAEAKTIADKIREEKARMVIEAARIREENAKKRGERGEHRDILVKGATFKTHVEALNECFGYNHKQFRAAYKQIDEENCAWFPSIAKRVMDEYATADTSAGWLNILCENDTVILEKNIEDPNKNVTRDKASNRFVFAKFDGEDVYTFVGLFSSNPVPTDQGFRYELLGTKIDLNTLHVLDN